jgi:nucleoside-diphosphate-sugar epimerase
MIVVAGGTGTLGQRLVPRLVERGLSVRVFTAMRHERGAQISGR